MRKITSNPSTEIALAPDDELGAGAEDDPAALDEGAGAELCCVEVVSGPVMIAVAEVNVVEVDSELVVTAAEVVSVDEVVVVCLQINPNEHPT